MVVYRVLRRYVKASVPTGSVSVVRNHYQTRCVYCCNVNPRYSGICYSVYRDAEKNSVGRIPVEIYVLCASCGYIPCYAGRIRVPVVIERGDVQSGNPRESSSFANGVGSYCRKSRWRLDCSARENRPVVGNGRRGILNKFPGRGIESGYGIVRGRSGSNHVSGSTCGSGDSYYSGRTRSRSGEGNVRPLYQLYGTSGSRKRYGV